MNNSYNKRNNETTAGEYVTTMLKHQGVAVCTVADGWVFSFTRQKLFDLVRAIGNEEAITIFVESSEKKPMN